VHALRAPGRVQTRALPPRPPAPSVTKPHSSTQFNCAAYVAHTCVPVELRSVAVY
jgi:hypothetical protein